MTVIDSKTARHDVTLPPALRWCHRLAYWMDEAFTLPFTDIRIGLDAIIGLVPGLGDGVSLLVSLVPIGVAVAWRLPWVTIAAMVGAVVLDVLVGTIPVLGDVFDAGFKANRYNARQLHKAWLRHHQAHTRASDAVVDV